MLIGDLNCDLSRPDKGANEGKTRMNFTDVYGLTNLIKVPTRVGVESSLLTDVNSYEQATCVLFLLQECLILASLITILFTLFCGYNVQNSSLEQL